MPDQFRFSHETIQAGRNWIKRQSQPDEVGYIGRLNTDGTYTYAVSGQPGYVYVRILRGRDVTHTAIAVNQGAPLVPTLQVEMWYEGGRLVIRRPDVTSAIQLYGDAAPSATIPPHTPSVGSGADDYVESGRFLPGLVRHPTPTETENGIGLTVVIEGLSYDDGRKVKRYLNLQTPSDYRPATSGKRWWVSVYQDVDGEIKASTTGSTEVVLPMQNMLETAIYDIAVPVGAYRLAGVVLENGQTTVTSANTRIVDVRNFLTPALAYQTVQDDGTPMTRRRNLNLIAGTNVTLTVTDNSGDDSTDVEIDSTGGSGYDTIEDDGTPVTQRPTLNLIAGANITLTVTDDGGNNRTDVEIEASVSGGALAHSFVGYNTIGGSSTAMATATVYYKQITLAADSLLVSIDAYIEQTSVSSVASIAAYVVADDAGVPGDVVSLGVYYAAPAYINLGSETARWLSIPASCWLTAGTYWVAVLKPDANGVINLYYDGSGGDYTQTQSGKWISDGVANTGASGTPANSGNKYSIRASVLT